MAVPICPGELAASPAPEFYWAVVLGASPGRVPGAQHHPEGTCKHKPGRTGGSKLRSSFLPARYRALSSYSAAEGRLLLVWLRLLFRLVFVFFCLVGFFLQSKKSKCDPSLQKQNRGSTPEPRASSRGSRALRPAGWPGSGEWPELVLAMSPFCFSIKSQTLVPPNQHLHPLLLLFASSQALSWPKPSHSLVQSASSPLGPVWPGVVAPAPLSSAPKLLWAWLLGSTRPDQASARQGGGAGSGRGPRVQ